MVCCSIWTYGNPDIFASEAWEGSINGVHFGSYTAGSVKVRGGGAYAEVRPVDAEVSVMDSQDLT